MGGFGVLIHEGGEVGGVEEILHGGMLQGDAGDVVEIIAIAQPV